jgi:hypothetical protein
MSLKSWLQGDSQKPSSFKRKSPETEISDSNSPAKKKIFTKELRQSSFDWYVQDTNGLWHCKLCRENKHDNAYAKGHEVPAKTTNH